MNFLNKDYGLNDYNMPILPYRLSGSDEYTERDIIDLTEDKIEVLQNTFNKNDKDSSINKIKIFPLTDGERLYIDYNEMKLTSRDDVFSTYLTANLYQVIDENGNVLVNNYLDIYSFNDGKYGINLKVMRKSDLTICEDFDGLLKFLHDIGFKF